MSTIRIQTRRTLGTTPPPDLAFGELAFAEGIDTLFVGRSDGSKYSLNQPELPPLAPVAFTNRYADLDGLPAIPMLPTLSTVATTGDYRDLTNLPTIPTLPTLAQVATTGDYNHLTNLPAIPTLPTLAQVATTGDYNHLTNLPVIPTLPTLAQVATSGDYRDLTNRPTIPTVATKSTTPPANPSPGMEWTQIDSQGNVIRAWHWDSINSEWVGRLIPLTFVGNNDFISANNFSRLPKPFPRFLLVSWHYSVHLATPIDGNNFWTVNLFRRSVGVETPIVSIALNSTAGGIEASIPLNEKSSSYGSFQQFKTSFIKSGTAGNLNSPHAVLTVREIYSQ